MTFKPFVACFMVLLSASALADQSSKDAKLLELMQLQGLTELIDQQRVHAQEQAKSIGPQMTAEFQRHIPAASEETMAEIETAFLEFVAAVDGAWTTQEAVEVWSQLYGQQVSEAELDQIIAFYRSPVGRKDAEATQAAMPQWQAFFQERGTAAMQAAMGEYVERIKAIAASAVEQQQ